MPVRFCLVTDDYDRSARQQDIRSRHSLLIQQLAAHNDERQPSPAANLSRIEEDVDTSGDDTVEDSDLEEYDSDDSDDSLDEEQDKQGQGRLGSDLGTDEFDALSNGDSDDSDNEESDVSDNKDF